MKKILMLSLAGLVLSGPAFAADVEGKEGGPRQNKWFEKTDTDGNGSISKAEFMSKHEARFVEADTNKDGAISKAEADAEREKWAEAMKEKRAERKKARDEAKAKLESQAKSAPVKKAE